MGGGSLDTLRYLIAFAMIISGMLCRDTVVWSNPVTRFLSGISFEIYLCHMLVYRAVELVKLDTLFGKNIWSYIFTCCIVFGGAVPVAWCYQLIERKIVGACKAHREKKRALAAGSDSDSAEHAAGETSENNHLSGENNGN